jgi:hypothetical protein
LFDGIIQQATIEQYNTRVQGEVIQRCFFIIVLVGRLVQPRPKLNIWEREALRVGKGFHLLCNKVSSLRLSCSFDCNTDKLYFRAESTHDCNVQPWALVRKGISMVRRTGRNSFFTL